MVKNLSCLNSDWSDYEISDEGFIRSCVTGRRLNGHITNKGYIVVNVNHVFCKLHRLVALAFVPQINETHNCVHHINGDKTNNAASNLEWICQAEHNSLHKKGVSLKKLKKLTEAQVTECKALRSKGISYANIALVMGVSKTTVMRHCKE